MMDFKVFLEAYLAAIKGEDKGFMKGVYQDWFESSGVVPKEQEDYFYGAMFGDLKQLVGCPLTGTESMDDFDIAHLKAPDGSELTLVFRKKGDSWIYFDARTNLMLFKKVYAINYDVKGGRLRILFNGKRSPIVGDIEAGRNGFNSMINSALEVGGNEITLQTLDGGPVEVSLRISSGARGEIVDSSQGDVLSWNGTVKEPVKLDFTAE
jgi:hypothetical protein